MHFSVLQVVGFAAAAMAMPGLPFGPRATVPRYVAPKASDSRSPCPGLNTLANHGYLPHDGRDVTIDDIVVAAAKGFNFASDIIHAVAEPLFAALGNLTIADLEEFNAHGKTEMRASTTRLDFGKGDTLHVNPARLQAMLDDSDTKVIDVHSLAKTRRRVEGLTGPPAVTQGEITAGLGTTALVLMVISSDASFRNGDWSKVSATKAIAKPWLAEERLPTEAGWKRPSQPRTVQDFVALLNAVTKAESEL